MSYNGPYACTCTPTMIAERRRCEGCIAEDSDARGWLVDSSPVPARALSQLPGRHLWASEDDGRLLFSLIHNGREWGQPGASSDVGTLNFYRHAAGLFLSKRAAGSPVAETPVEPAGERGDDSSVNEHGALIGTLTAAGWAKVGGRTGHYVRLRNDTLPDAVVIVPTDPDAPDYRELLDAARASAPVPAHPGVTRLLDRCDIEDRVAGEYGWIQTTEVRALLAGGEQQHGHVLRKVWKGDDGKDQRGPWVSCPTCGPAPEADHVPDAADPTATPTEEIR